MARSNVTLSLPVARISPEAAAALSASARAASKSIGRIDLGGSALASVALANQSRQLAGVLQAFRAKHPEGFGASVMGLTPADRAQLIDAVKPAMDSLKLPPSVAAQISDVLKDAVRIPPINFVPHVQEAAELSTELAESPDAADVELVPAIEEMSEAQRAAHRQNVGLLIAQVLVIVGMLSAAGNVALAGAVLAALVDWIRVLNGLDR